MIHSEEEATIHIMEIEQHIEEIEQTLHYELYPEVKEFYHSMNKELVRISNNNINDTLILESKFRKLKNFKIANRFRILLERQNAILQIVKKLA